jgi:hypothetical protein
MGEFYLGFGLLFIFSEDIEILYQKQTYNRSCSCFVLCYETRRLATDKFQNIEYTVKRKDLQSVQ